MLRLLVLCLSFYPWLVQAEPSRCVPTHFDETVTLSQVIDGDTIKLDDGRVVRLIGIDAPEFDQAYPELSEPFAAQVRQFLLHNVQAGQTLHLAFDMKRLDPQGRTLAYVYTEAGLHLQELLLSHGYAKARVYQNDYFWRCLAQVEQQARENHIGLWAESAYQPMTVEQLSREDLNHWREVRGVITGFERKGQDFWLIIDKKLYVDVPSEEFGNFSNILPLNMLETPVIVRGELYYSYKKWQLISHHPSQISLQNKP
ncbi:thermonuclease family protein [Shewanella sp. Isolate11]|uniref:thermonuclease family protein n=1 Tax=Shewanella sp. Isolate11 TaxID=2908530 RepID=UPI001EFCC66C|nr:thermonuclease family protein [Shewanella sp. Isolate11]MCG9695470.1 thermonuclease family protein [Shewanella sp. Isolate11]